MDTLGEKPESLESHGLRSISLDFGKHFPSHTRIQVRRCAAVRHVFHDAQCALTAVKLQARPPEYFANAWKAVNWNLVASRIANAST
jgi:hypothetical protein